MAKITKIAISLPEDMLSNVERERRESGESRSEFFRRAVEALLREQRERGAIKKYIEAYRKYPETEEEIEFAGKNADEILAEEPW